MRTVWAMGLVLAMLWILSFIGMVVELFRSDWGPAAGCAVLFLALFLLWRRT